MFVRRGARRLPCAIPAPNSDEAHKMRLGRPKVDERTSILRGLFLARIRAEEHASLIGAEREEKMETVFVNPERCIGCRQCEFACAVEHSESQDAVAALFEEPPPRSRIHVAPGAAQFTSFPGKCRHCNPAPCQQVCPSGAISRDADQDLVLIDPKKCITCAMCAMVCPFDAVSFHAQRNGMPARTVAVKCDGCVGRMRRGEEPACSEVCKVDALVFGELNDLVKAGRVREAHAVLSAVSALEPEAPRGPDNVEAWRAWGRSATAVRED